MTDLAALADELRERLNAIAYAKAIHGQDPTDTTWARYETAKCEAADWLYGKGDELQAALRASRPEPAADAVETAYREGYRTCWHFNVATDDPADEEIIGIEWRDSEAKKALSALPRPEADEGAVRKADEIFDDITRGGPTVDAVMREDWATVAEWMRQRAEDGLAVTRAALAAAQEGQP